MVKKVLICAGAVGFLVFLAYGFGLFGVPDDRTQIQQALEKAIKASKEGKPGSVLHYLSNNFRVNGYQYKGAEIADLIKTSKPHIEVANQEPVIQGDFARITSPTTLSLSLPSFTATLKEVTFDFAKENGVRMIWFPAKQWKLTKVNVPQEVYEDLYNQYGGEIPSFNPFN